MESRMDAAAAMQDSALSELLLTVLGVGLLAVTAITTALLTV